MTRQGWAARYRDMKTRDNKPKPLIVRKFREQRARQTPAARLGQLRLFAGLMPDDLRLGLPAAERRRPMRELGALGPRLRGSKKAPAEDLWIARIRHGCRLRAVE